ncbi:MAG: cell division protein ZipA [Candidatus Wenzhouxiangella sp. M2_3B_020]
MDNLRLILILIGLAVLGLIWLLHRPDGSSKRPGASRREERRREPHLVSPPADGAGEDIGDEDETAAEWPQQTTLPDLGSEAPASALDETASRRRTPESRGPEADVPPDAEWRDPEPVRRAASAETVSAEADSPVIVTLYVRAREGRNISGLGLLDAAIKAGLRFGEMKIFHRRHRGATRPVFSMANITRPGSFDPSGWNLFETPGVTLFMTLPGPVSALDAWDAMLATGQRLAEILDADLMDDNQCLLTRQRIAQIREEMREFDRRSGLAGPKSS